MKTKVVFRKFSDGDVVALFPFEKWCRGMCASYMHNGQHSPADYMGVVELTKLAKPDEYQPLQNELKSIGYDLQILSRRPRNCSLL